MRIGLFSNIFQDGFVYILIELSHLFISLTTLLVIEKYSAQERPRVFPGRSDFQVQTNCRSAYNRTPPLRPTTRR